MLMTRIVWLEDIREIQDHLGSGNGIASASPHITTITIITTILHRPMLKCTSDLSQALRICLCSSSTHLLSSTRTLHINMHILRPHKHRARRIRSATTYHQQHTRTHTQANRALAGAAYSSSRLLA